jgi:hypothetical protein
MPKPFCAPTDIATVTPDHMVGVSVQSPKIPVAEFITWGPVILLSQVPPEGATVDPPSKSESNVHFRREHDGAESATPRTSFLPRGPPRTLRNHSLLLFLITTCNKAPTGLYQTRPLSSSDVR